MDGGSFFLSNKRYFETGFLLELVIKGIPSGIFCLVEGDRTQNEYQRYSRETAGLDRLDGGEHLAPGHDHRCFSSLAKNYEETAMVPATSNYQVSQYTLDYVVSLVTERFGLRKFMRQVSLCLMERRVRTAFMSVIFLALLY